MRLLAEWEKQDGVLLAWPHEATDWLPHLESAQRNFAMIAKAISEHEMVIVVGPECGTIAEKIRSAGANMDRTQFSEMPTNDTWARDFGPIVVADPTGNLKIFDFGFNGWGLKYAANHDNLITRHLHRQGVFGAVPIETVGLVLEGGSLETDGHGTLLTTSKCLLNPNRNPHLTKDELELTLSNLMGFDHFLWLDHGALIGDDTDSHIDTLARLCPHNTILYVQCDDPHDEQHDELRAMEQQLRSFRTKTGEPYRLIALPSPEAHYGTNGQRLPATYANYLIINDTVLVPTYADPKDGDALTAIAQGFPDRQIQGIDCRALIAQYGSLHCVTMQLPKGALAPQETFP